MTTKLDKGTIDYKAELLRKSIHLLSLSIAIVYYFITKELALTMLIPLTLFSLIMDLARYLFPAYKKKLYSIFGFMLREHEINSKQITLSGATYVLIAALLTVIFFAKVFVILGIAVLIFGDIFAALIGRKFGKHKFLFKSLEGTVAFFIFGSLVMLATPKIEGSLTEYLIGFAAVAVSAIVENVSYGWADDNLTIPISVCLTMAVLYGLFLPNLQLILPNVPV
ncbi:MAG: dolichol kinase [Bacteroidetes bacterium]|nr:dolichol kinase [Bacteroidota bacterium]MBU1114022.1 dolichol kinase [Bacteroidota bacterium]MBU1798962.1 dolichol kinase [Bacteroidota bacterium]